MAGGFGELVYCKASGSAWDESTGVFKRPDVGFDLQIRCAPCKARFPPQGFGNLLIYEDDDPRDRFVLVVGNSPNFVIRGWISGHMAMRDEFWRSDFIEPCWSVPCARLNLELDLGELW
jgi:hypothetical protein